MSVRLVALALAGWLWPAVVPAQRVTAPPRQEVRPFITDDARTVGGGLAQLESWVRRDEETDQLWFLTAVGPTDWLELTLGGVVGTDRTAEREAFTYATPLLQAKVLLRPYAPGAPPGLSLVAGTFLPEGRGILVPPGSGAFAFAIATQSWGERDRVLLHANVGANVLRREGRSETISTWGLGSQFRLVGGLHGVAEVFSGDPYVPGSGRSVQVGFRHFVNDQMQLDGTVGEGVAGAVQLPRWWSVGVRLVSPRLF